jgi:hypothetical protein
MRKGCFEDLRGRVFDRLIVVSLAGQNSSRATMWGCLCQCGNKMVARRDSLINGAARSCGCLNDERRVSHGCARKGHYSSEYIAWSHILQRCENKKNKAYKNYGARGISVCERWHKFENFLADMGLKPSSKHSLDRINNDGNYEPWNCRWATRVEQNRNTRRTIKINGISLAELAGNNGLKYNLVKLRYYRGDRGERLVRSVVVK